MRKDWVLTQDAFDGLLEWLDADRNRAGSKYEAIRLRLIKIFTCRGCADAEELADETINRVTARIGEVAGEYQGDPARYFYGVSQKVHLEYLRKAHGQESLQDNSAPGNSQTQDVWSYENVEPEYDCLEQCLEHLPKDNRELVISYYQQDRQGKIDHHKLMAKKLGIAVNALRIRAHRIRITLQKCVQECMHEQPAH
jgi:RNA polymerase sigma factor (sigma-70 family)